MKFSENVILKAHRNLKKISDVLDLKDLEKQNQVKLNSNNWQEIINIKGKN